MIREILSENFNSTSTIEAPSYSYTTSHTTPKSYYINPEETIADKEDKLGLPYSPILNKFDEEELELVNNIAKKFRNTGDININYKIGWNKNSIFPYLIEFLGQEAKKGNAKAALKLEKIFDPLESKDMREKLIRSYNKTRNPDKSGKIKGLI